MKNKMCFLIPILISFVQIKNVSAQGSLLKEWFGQKKTQREYLMNQIAALQVYIEYAKKGYRIYDKGLNLIGSFKDGEFNLHEDFFLSLKVINPEVARYGKVAATVQLQYNMLRHCQRTLKDVKTLDLPAAKKEYINQVLNRFLKDSDDLIEELLILTTTSKLELTDDQRLSRIDKLYYEMEDRYIAVQHFREDILLVEQSKSTERKNIETHKALGN